ANDNFGRWQDDFRKVVRRATADDAAGRVLVAPLEPGPDDYFVLKPKLSGFFATPLEVLLEHLGAETLILAGVAADFCVLATALDAHMRGFRVVIPEDCTASENPTRLADALAYARRACDADTRPQAEQDFNALRQGRADVRTEE
ncbi:MAG TPA: isochorismatase family cysteine hydrolase, partial [Rubricoccaceae bacterium]|nr:isochorismatase family cysteine hydrolase [Rubricoccaceae bacterium]